MARFGSFAGPTEEYGTPLSVIHPIDNKFPQFFPEIEKLDIPLDKKRELQAKAEELQAALLLGRDSD